MKMLSQFAIFWSLCTLAFSQCIVEDNLRLTGTYNPNTEDYLTQIWVDGDIGYFGSSGAFVDIVDLSDPVDPVLITRYYLLGLAGSGSAFDVQVNNGLLFVALLNNNHDIDFHIADVRDPMNPSGLVDVAVPDYIQGSNLLFHNQFLYVADCWTDRLAIYDLRAFNPDNPPDSMEALWLVDGIGETLGLNAQIHNLAIKDNKLFVSAWDAGLWVLDITDIANEPPTLLGNAPGENVQDASPTADGEFVIISERELEKGLKVFRMSDDGLGGLDFTLTDRVTLPIGQASSSRSIYMDGNRLYSTWFTGGLRIYDFNPASGDLEFFVNYQTDPLTQVLDVFPIEKQNRMVIASPFSDISILEFENKRLLLDLNIDMRTAIDDQIQLINQIGPCDNPNDCLGDINGDFKIGYDDLYLTYSCWGSRQQQP